MKNHNCLKQLQVFGFAVMFAITFFSDSSIAGAAPDIIGRDSGSFTGITASGSKADIQFPTLRTLIYVDCDATGAGDGSSWEDAYTTLQEALDYTNAHGTTLFTIWVAEGVYYPDEGSNHTNNDESEAFMLRYDNVFLYGGFDGTRIFAG